MAPFVRRSLAVAAALLVFGDAMLWATRRGFYLYSYQEKGWALTFEPGKPAQESRPLYTVCILWNGYKRRRFFPHRPSCPWIAELEWDPF